MNTGQIISGVGHFALIGWLLVGNVFRAEPLPIEATEVSVITGEQYAALVAAQQPPQSASEVAQPVQPDPPVEPVVAPEPPADPTVPQVQPEVAPTPTVDDPPEATQTTPPPEAVVDDTTPVLQPPAPDVAVLVPQVSDRPVPRPSERVAPEPVVLPDPEAKPDPVEQQAVEQSETGETVQEPQQATAPEAASTEIVTEAEAPSSSLRPPKRPTRPTQQATAAPEPATQAPAQSSDTADTSDAINDALAGVLNEPAEPAAPSGPPLSFGEKDALRVAVGGCWNLGTASTEALSTTVVVAVSLTPDGQPKIETIKLLSSSGGSANAAEKMYNAARSAIIRCSKGGYDLPRDKYEQWKDIEMTFNPEGMRLK